VHNLLLILQRRELKKDRNQPSNELPFFIAKINACITFFASILFLSTGFAEIISGNPILHLSSGRMILSTFGFGMVVNSVSWTEPNGLRIFEFNGQTTDREQTSSSGHFKPLGTTAEFHRSPYAIMIVNISA
jgi:hypothetical protein